MTPCLNLQMLVLAHLYAKTDSASLAALRSALQRKRYTAVEIGVGAGIAVSLTTGRRSAQHPTAALPQGLHRTSAHAARAARIHLQLPRVTFGRCLVHCIMLNEGLQTSRRASMQAHGVAASWRSVGETHCARYGLSVTQFGETTRVTPPRRRCGVREGPRGWRSRCRGPSRRRGSRSSAARRR